MNDDCINWGGTLDKNGYGVKKINYKQYYAHRLAWEERFGKIPDGLIICHKCDNPACINSEHLFLGNQAKNMLDRDQKGRCAHGTKNPNHKLTNKQVREIRQIYKPYDKKCGATSLAFHYNVSNGLISAIAKRRAWRYVI